MCGCRAREMVGPSGEGGRMGSDGRRAETSSRTAHAFYGKHATLIHSSSLNLSLGLLGWQATHSNRSSPPSTVARNRYPLFVVSSTVPRRVPATTISAHALHSTRPAEQAGKHARDLLSCDNNYYSLPTGSHPLRATAAADGSRARTTCRPERPIGALRSRFIGYIRDGCDHL